MTHKNDIFPSGWGWGGGGGRQERNQSLALTVRDANLDTKFHISAGGTRESRRPFLSLVCGKKLFVLASLLAEGI